MSTHSVSNPKIHPGRRPGRGWQAAERAKGAAGRRPDGTPDDDDRVEIGPTPLAFREWEAAGVRVPNLSALREYRLARLRGELRRHDCAGLVLFDPLNIRYGTDTTNMQGLDRPQSDAGLLRRDRGPPSSSSSTARRCTSPTTCRSSTRCGPRSPSSTS